MTNCWRRRWATALGCGNKWRPKGRVILALDGLQPDVGHEVLWVIRDCLSGEVLLARSLLSGTAHDLAPLLREVASARLVCRWWVWSVTARPRSAARWSGRCLRFLTNSAISTSYVRQHGRSSQPTAMPRRC